MAGALLEAELEAAVVAAGFVGFAIPWRADVFGEAPQASSAANFGTLGINLRARKAATEEEWAAALAALSCEAPASPGPRFGADAFYDAGERGCTEGPLDEIAALLRRLAPGQTLEVRASGMGVVEDLPAWCRLAGHALERQEGGHFLIRRG
ncbi:MAG TPA: sulfurtransferase TusA family protein [Thermomicrobiales bacterium]|nr:sulfurtransferase TusA family protein [Thermomicrobiales bacterium]